MTSSPLLPCLIGSRALLIAFLQRSQPRPLNPSQSRPFRPISFCSYPAFITYGGKWALPSLFHAADGSWSSGVVMLRNQWLLRHVQWKHRFPFPPHLLLTLNCRTMFCSSGTSCTSMASCLFVLLSYHSAWPDYNSTSKPNPSEICSGVCLEQSRAQN